MLCLFPAFAQFDSATNEGTTCWRCPVCGYTVSLASHQLATVNPYTHCPVCYSAYAFSFVQVPCQATTGYITSGYSTPGYSQPGYSGATSNTFIPLSTASGDGSNSDSIPDTREAGTLAQNLSGNGKTNGLQTAQDWLDKGNDLYNQGNYEGAIQAFDRAIEMDSQHAESAWYNEGNAFYKMDELDEAIAAYSKAVELEPLYADAWYNMGLALTQMGKYDEAVQAYNSAIMIDPQYAEDANFWYEKGNALYELNKFEEAITAYDSSIELDPRFADVWYNKGAALKALGRTTEADAAFAEADELWQEEEELDEFWSELLSSEETPSFNESGTSIDSNASSAGLMTADDWKDKGTDLYDQGKYNESINQESSTVES